MFEEALAFAKKYNGIIVGSYAVRGLISDFPAEYIDVLVPWGSQIDGQQICTIHALDCDIYEIENSKIRVLCPLDDNDVVSSFLARVDFPINKCYYDANGVHHAGPDARKAALTRKMHVSSAQLDRVHKYRSRGFEITYDDIADTCEYLPELHEQIHATPAIKCIIYRDMTVTQHMLRDASDVELWNCRLNNCIVRTSDVFMSRCIGTVQLLHTVDFSTMNDCEFLLVEILDDVNLKDHNDMYMRSGAYVSMVQRNWSCTPETIYEQDDRMLLKLRFMAGLPCPDVREIKNILDRLLMNETRIEQEDINALLVIMSKNKTITKLLTGQLRYVLEKHPMPDYCHVRVPAEWVHCLRLLCWLTERGLCAPIYQYSTPYINCQCSDVCWSGKITPGPALMANDIPTFATLIEPSNKEFFRTAQFRPAHICVAGFRSEVSYVIDIDLDGISDMIDREGYTPEVSEFLRDQLEIDSLHDFALLDMLHRRPDIGLSGLNL